MAALTNFSADGSWTADSGTTADAVPRETFSAAQYGQAARNLFPRGRAWNRQDGSNQASFCDALGQVYAQQDADSIQMLSDFFPATATQGLPEWNSSVGLPDPCSGAPATTADNQQQIVAKLAATGGQSISYYTELAAALGYDIEIAEFCATSPGTGAPAGMITNINDWDHTWQVTITNPNTAPASTTPLECLLERYKPAHTQFYIVVGTQAQVSTRLFSVSDTVARPLLIQV